MKRYEKTLWGDGNAQNLARGVGYMSISICNCAFHYM